MRKLLSAMSAAAIAMSFAVTPVVPAMAMPAVGAGSISQNTSDVIKVQSRRDFQRGQDRRIQRGLQRRNGHYYYNGHRGYRHKRPGYRQHNGWWFPAGAFVAGAIISGALNSGGYNPPPRYRNMSSAHVRWCHDRYRSYRASDNTFQPYNGPRRQCYSPYN